MPAHSPLASLAGGIGSLLDVLREVDVRPIRTAAETPFALVFTSRDEPMAEHLAMLLYRGPRQNDLPHTRTSVSVPFDKRAAMTRADVAIIVTREFDSSGNRQDNAAELALAHELERAKVPTVIAFIEDQGAVLSQTQNLFRTQWLPAQPITLHLQNGVLDEAGAARQLVKAVRRLKAIDDLALARHLPAFRENVTRHMIEDVAFANAVYATGTGIFEVIPVVNIPLNAADIVVLTKNQAILAYKIAVAMGLSAEFREVMPQLAAVVGSGFAFRQIARQLIGLVPGLGLIPKVAVAFAGTHATGEVIYRWCATGDRISGDNLKMLFDRALERGKALAHSFIKRSRERRNRNPKRLNRGE